MSRVGKGNKERTFWDLVANCSCDTMHHHFSLNRRLFRVSKAREDAYIFWKMTFRRFFGILYHISVIFGKMNFLNSRTSNDRKSSAIISVKGQTFFSPWTSFLTNVVGMCVFYVVWRRGDLLSIFPPETIFTCGPRMKHCDIKNHIFQNFLSVAPWYGQNENHVPFISSGVVSNKSWKGLTMLPSFVPYYQKSFYLIHYTLLKILRAKFLVQFWSYQLSKDWLTILTMIYPSLSHWLAHVDIVNWTRIVLFSVYNFVRLQRSMLCS